MADDPKPTDPVATLQTLLREAEAACISAERDFIEKKQRLELLKRALEGHVHGSPRRKPTPIFPAGGPSLKAREFLRTEGEPRPIKVVVDAVYQKNPHFQLMNQGRTYIERSLSRSCTGGTILYFTGERIGLPEHALEKKWKHEIDWAKIKKIGFKPHHMQRNKLKELFSPEILAKLLSLKRPE